MEPVGRFVTMTAAAGKGDELAELMLRVAEEQRSTPGCELYLVGRVSGEPDVVCVSELWRDQEALDASLEALKSNAGQAQLQEVMALLAGPVERIDFRPLGGAGYLAGGSGASIVNLDEVDDMAPRFGYGEMGEARFATDALGAARTGVSLQRLRPGARQAFGHRHRHAEEVYVILDGSGRVRIGDDIHELRPRDAVRVAPESTRAFEAGPEGLTVLAVGVRHTGDAEMAPEFWRD